MSKDNHFPTYEAACADGNFNPEDMLPVFSEKAPDWLKKRGVADAKLTVIANAINQGRVPKPGEIMYFPVFYKDASNNNAGFGLSLTYCGRWLSATTVGERHEFFTREDALFFGRNFLELHKDHKIIDKNV